jgi:hypothetical protein
MPQGEHEGHVGLSPKNPSSIIPKPQLDERYDY